MPTTATLTQTPSTVPLLLKALATSSRKPGREPVIPELELRLSGLRADRERLAAYCGVCGFDSSDVLPITYPQVMANPLVMSAMAHPEFPLPMMGIVHVSSRFEQPRPLAVDQTYDVVVRTGESRRAKAGLEFDLISELTLGGETVYRGVMSVLYRIPGPKQQSPRPTAPEAHLADYIPFDAPESQGRRYAAVSGDYNPIHLYAPTAKLLGFKRHIAHGMWSVARCAALLQPQLEHAPKSLDVAFKQPLFLPGKVAVKYQPTDTGIEFALLSRSSDKVHLAGSLR